MVTLGSDLSDNVILEVQNLQVSLSQGQNVIRIVNGIDYIVRCGEIFGIVGESGSGKSMGAYALMRLLQPNAWVSAGEILYEGRDILSLSDCEMTALRGREIGMIFQNPVVSLDPAFTIGEQIIETIQIHDRSVSLSVALELAEVFLASVGIQHPKNVLRQYPFELSGGMCQRAMIAIALTVKPKLLIADEPTTALDVTIQSQIHMLLRRHRDESNMSLIYITHDFSAVAELCDNVAVMYDGYIVEQGRTDAVLANPQHPYTKGLLSAITKLDTPKAVPLPQLDIQHKISESTFQGCSYFPRCAHPFMVCSERMPPYTAVDEEHTVRCWRMADGGVSVE